MLCVISWYIVPRYREPILSRKPMALVKNSDEYYMGKVSNYHATIRQTVFIIHYTDVIMGAIASPITSLTIVYWTLYSGADQRKHQSSMSLTFVRGIPRWPVNSPHKWSVTRKMSIWWHHHVLRWIVLPGKFPTRCPLHISVAKHENWINLAPIWIDHLSDAGWKKILLQATGLDA